MWPGGCARTPARPDTRRDQADQRDDADTVVFELCRPDVAFLSKIASPAFAINDAGWLPPTSTRPRAIRRRSSTRSTAPGPYRLESWTHGSEVSLARNDGYWGDKAANERFIARWYDNAGQRIAELQNASVDGVDDIDPTAVQAVVDDTELKLAPRPGLDVFYAGFTDTFAPFDNELVRRAIATGIDRQRIVDTYFPPGSELATQYTRARSPTGAVATPWYEYDPTLGQGDAGVGRLPGRLRLRRSSTAQRPTEYLPDPTGVATELKNQLLANLGIRAELQVVPDDTFLADAARASSTGSTCSARA
jgi:ABC-type transport system substrate-binding protein